MKIGILEAGDILEEASKPHADYGPMFHDFLTAVDPNITTEAFAIYEGNFPGSPSDADGWLISGSKFGVYEDHDWIPVAEDFIRDCVSQNVPVVGICFGHQLIAQALGGTVVKSDKGWGTGVNTYIVSEKPGWMADAPDVTNVLALHQDQVVTQPPNSTVFASSGFCEIAGLYYGNQERPQAISLQPHPEFSYDFVDTILRVRAGDPIPVADADKGRASLAKSVDGTDWARAIVSYFTRAHAA